MSGKNAATVEQLLSPALKEHAATYYEELLDAIAKSVVGGNIAEGFAVRLDAGDGKGKGLFATRELPKGEEMLREQALVGVQTDANRQDALVCAHCFRFLGSVEVQIAWRLLGMMEGQTIPEDDHIDTDIIVRNLLTGELRLPLPNFTSLPKFIQCPGGCSQMYCSSRCCASAWQSHHCLICPRQSNDNRVDYICSMQQPCPYHRPFNPSDLNRWPHDRRVFSWLLSASGIPSPEQPSFQTHDTSKPMTPIHSTIPSNRPVSSPDSGSVSTSHCVSSPASSTAIPVPPWLDTKSDADVLIQFDEFTVANEMDTMRLVAQTIAMVMCSSLHTSWLLTHPGSEEVCDVGSSQHSVALTRCRTILSSTDDPSDQDILTAATLASWEPFQMAMKALWWDCLVIPDEIEPAVYKRQLQVMVENSATLLREAMYDQRFHALFDKDLNANLMGLFELNSLGITVESPVEDFFDEYMAQRNRKQLGGDGHVIDKLKALLVDTDVPCDGVAFYSLQSCLNHANRPNCSCQKEIDEKDGSAVLLTSKSIKAGKELTITYIGDTRKMSEETIRSALAEYCIPYELVAGDS